MSKNITDQDSPIPKFMHLKIQRRDSVESSSILKEGEFMPIEDCNNNPKHYLTKFRYSGNHHVSECDLILHTWIAFKLQQ